LKDDFSVVALKVQVYIISISVSNLLGYCNQDPKKVQSVSSQGNLSICRENPEHGGGHTLEARGKIMAREGHLQTNLQGDKDDMWAVNSGHVCESTESSTITLLSQPEARP